MIKTVPTGVLLLVSYVITASSVASGNAEPSGRDLCMFADPNTHRIYDCAASSVFVLCRKLRRDVSYAECVRLLPIAEEGSSALDVKHALATLRFQIESFRVSVDELAAVQDPAIVWISFGGDELTPRQRLGHYFVLWPLSEGVVQVLDYPQEPATLSVDYWVEYLRSTTVQDLVVLLCRRQGQGKIKTVFPEGGSAAPRRGALPSRLDVGGQPATIVLRNDIRFSPSVCTDFGRVSEGSLLSHRFMLENEAGKVLHISKLQRSCSCSELTCDREMLDPGERCTVLMKTSLVGRSGKQAFTGAVVFAAEDKIPPVRLLAKGEAYRRVKVYPESIDFGQCEPDSEPVTKKVRIDMAGNVSTDVLRISRVRSHSPWIVATLVSPPEGVPHLGEIAVTLHPKDAIGAINSRIDVFVEGSDKPVASCQVKSAIHSEFLVRPSALLFRRSPGGSQAEVEIRHRGGKQIRMVGLRTTCGEVELTTAPATDLDHTLTLQVELSAEEGGLSRGELLLDLAVESEGDLSTVKVPFVRVGEASI